MIFQIVYVLLMSTDGRDNPPSDIKDLLLITDNLFDIAGIAPAVSRM